MAWQFVESALPLLGAKVGQVLIILLAQIEARCVVPLLARLDSVRLGHVRYLWQLKAIWPSTALRVLVVEAGLSLLICKLELALILRVLYVSVHLEIYELLIRVDEFVTRVGVDHRQLLYLFEVFLERERVADGVGLFLAVLVQL